MIKRLLIHLLTYICFSSYVFIGMAVADEKPSKNFKDLFDRCSNFIMDDRYFSVFDLNRVKDGELESLKINTPGVFYYKEKMDAVLHILGQNQCGVIDYNSSETSAKKFMTDWVSENPKRIVKVYDRNSKNGSFVRYLRWDSVVIVLSLASDNTKASVSFLKKQGGAHAR